MKLVTLFHSRLEAFIVYSMLLALTHNVRASQPPLLGVQRMSTGGLHTCAIVNGGAQCWGNNYQGQLGNGTTTHSTTPSAVTPSAVSGLNSGVTVIAAGTYHTCAVVNSGARCWGSNSQGKLGNGTYVSSSTPVATTGLDSGVTAIAARDSHTCAIVSGGVKCWGYNGFGELGNGTTNSTPAPSAVTALNSGVTAISVGNLYTCAIVNGAAQCWGYNSSGQLGNGTTTQSTTPAAVTSLTSGVAAIAAGDSHSCAIVNGGAQCWGKNTNGQLGNGTTAQSTTPIAVSGLSSDVIAIATGDNHTCALVSGDVTHPVKCWGANAAGQLGNGSTTDSANPVSVAFFPALVAGDSVASISAGGDITCALVTARGITKMQCWGDNALGGLGLGGLPPENPVPGLVAGLNANVTLASTGYAAYHHCAIVNGAAECWGDNTAGQLGNGIYAASSFAQLVTGLGSGATALTVGGSFSCAILGGSARCWGDNGYGELGNGTTTGSPLPIAVSGLSSGVTAISAGGGGMGSHACAIVSGGAKCWGGNYFGALGNGTTKDSFTPVIVTGLSSGVTAIAAGSGYTCAVINNGVQCWGDNNYGDLGNGTTAQFSATPVAVTGLSSGATAISAGAVHPCAIVNGGAWCWGYNVQGELGNGTYSTSSSTPVAVVGLNSGVTAISAGAYQTCAIVNGGAQCWGNNGNGELGNGTLANTSATPVAVVGLSSGVLAIAASMYHTCAIVTGGAEKCWGDDSKGELGDGRLLTAETPQTVVAGDEIFHNGFESN